MGADRYIRVGTTLYKIVQRPLISGDFLEIRVPWNYETLRQDHSKDFISKIEKYDGFCSVPSHTDYKRTIGRFFNQYEPVPYSPLKGECPAILNMLRHIFEEQFELGLDYLQLLYLKPMLRLPVLLLVSSERNTGKTSFMNFFKAIFAGNMTFNTNEDFHSQFNADWANKLIIAVDEVLLDRKEDSERIKNLSTAKSFKAEAKGKDRREVEFFAKFVLSSNNEDCPVIIEPGETRYWVRKVKPLVKENPDLLECLTKEIPHFLYFLQNRMLSTKKESRMWFRHDLLVTDALKRIISYNKGKIETEMLHIISDIMLQRELPEFSFCVVDMVEMLDQRKLKIEPSPVRRILQNRWRLKPSEKPFYYTTYKIKYDGTLMEEHKTGRAYTVDREKLDSIL